MPEKKREIKYLDPAFQAIKILNRPTRIKLHSIGLKKVALRMKINKEHLSEYSFDLPANETINQKISFETKLKGSWNNIELILQGVFLERSSSSGSIHSICSINYERRRVKRYHRLIIPLRKSISFFFQIEHHEFSTLDYTSIECIRVNYETFYLDVFLYKNDDKKKFIILDCPSKLNEEDFSEVAFSTLVTLGYVLGKFPQDEGYYFAYDRKEMKDVVEFKFSGLRPSVSSIYHPVNSNPYGFRVRGKKGEYLMRKLKPISSIQFSTLCRRVHAKPELRAALLLSIEASASSLLIMSTSMAVILESLTELYASENPNNFFIVKKGKLSGSILKAIRQTVESHASELGEFKGLFLNKVNLLNQVPNRSKLILPFQLLQIKLNDDDMYVIEKRNNLLHGNLDVGLKGDIDLSDKELHFIASKLYTLNSKLILKQAGYDGYIVNWPVHNKHVHGKKLAEEVFRLI